MECQAGIVQQSGAGMQREGQPLEADARARAALRPVQMAATVGVYMFTVGATALLWGPFCDRYGRRNTLLLSSFCFIGFSIGCTFSPTVHSEYCIEQGTRSGR